LRRQIEEEEAAANAAEEQNSAEQKPDEQKPDEQKPDEGNSDLTKDAEQVAEDDSVKGLQGSAENSENESKHDPKDTDESKEATQKDDQSDTTEKEQAEVMNQAAKYVFSFLKIEHPPERIFNLRSLGSLCLGTLIAHEACHYLEFLLYFSCSLTLSFN
jgi:archaellum component FlaD/FlaE